MRNLNNIFETHLLSLAAIFRQVEDMTFVVVPEANNTDVHETDNDGRNKRNAIIPSRFGGTLWPNGLVPYSFAPGIFDGNLLYYDSIVQRTKLIQCWFKIHHLSNTEKSEQQSVPCVLF